MQNFNCYKINETLSHKYYKLPQELFVNPLYKDTLTSDSKLLYAFLLDRMSLSAKNNWCDENSNIYLIFTRKEVQEKLGLCDRTVTKAFKQLADVNLIYEKKQGANKPNLIYVGKIRHLEVDNWTRKNYDSGYENNSIQESNNTRPINTNNIYTNTIINKKRISKGHWGRKYSDEFLNSFYDIG